MICLLQIPTHSNLHPSADAACFKESHLQYLMIFMYMYSRRERFFKEHYKQILFKLDNQSRVKIYLNSLPILTRK